MSWYISAIFRQSHRPKSLPMRKAILLPAIFLTACSSYPSSLPSIKPYSMDIQQGNVVTSKMLLQLRPGMTKAQVRFVMGTPMISDSFHANRWDYFYRMQKAGKIVEQRRITLDFEDEKLAHVRGDVVPAGTGGNAAQPEQAGSKEPISIKPASGTPPKDKGLIDKLKFWNSDDEKAPAKAGQPAPDEKLEALPPLLEEAAPRSAAPVQPIEPEVKPVPVPVQKPQEKGLLDKLKFWESDEPKPATKPQAAPAPATKSLPDIADEKAEPLPPLMETPEAAPQPTSSPAKAEAKPMPQKVSPPAKTEPAPVVKPAEKPAARAEPKPAPKPQEDLPPEGDPGYFERLLEKIGF